MSRRKPVRLFRYSRQASAARTLRVLRAAWPDTDFRLVPESGFSWGWNIRATLPSGQGGLVQRESLALIAHHGAQARQSKES
jgi:hypothetical protein